MVAHATDTRVIEQTAKFIRETTASAITKSLVSDIRIRDVESAKRKLPAVCWGAKFKNGRREAGENGANIVPTGLCFLDIDHIAGRGKSVSEQWAQVNDYYCQYIEGKEAENQIVHVQVSPSGKGLHIVFLMPEGCGTIEAGQRRMARQLALPQYDDKCKDMGRMLFLSRLEDTLYDALDCLTE